MSRHSIVINGTKEALAICLFIAFAAIGFGVWQQNVAAGFFVLMILILFTYFVCLIIEKFFDAIDGLIGDNDDEVPR